MRQPVQAVVLAWNTRYLWLVHRHRSRILALWPTSSAASPGRRGRRVPMKGQLSPGGTNIIFGVFLNGRGQIELRNPVRDTPARDK